MTKEEAQLFFPINKDDNLLDVYEALLFEYKQFFISKPVFHKIYQAKKIKMLKMHESFILLGGILPDSTKKTKNTFVKHQFSDSILETFNTYQKHRNLLKTEIVKCNNVLELIPVINQILELQRDYLDCWGEFENIKDENILISKEIDPMILLMAIQEFYKLGGITFKDIHSKRNILPILLLNEAKRLSLCRKFE